MEKLKRKNLFTAIFSKELAQKIYKKKYRLRYSFIRGTTRSGMSYSFIVKNS